MKINSLLAAFGGFALIILAGTIISVIANLLFDFAKPIYWVVVGIVCLIVITILYWALEEDSKPSQRTGKDSGGKK